MISKLLRRNHYASRCGDVNFPPVVVDGRDQAGLVSPDIENGEFPDLVGMGKTERISWMLEKRPPRICLNQWTRLAVQSGCNLAKSFSRFRVITCMRVVYLWEETARFDP